MSQNIIIDTETYGQGKLSPRLNCQDMTLGATLKENGVYKEWRTPNEIVNYLINQIEKEKKRHGRSYIWGFNMQYDFYAIFRDYLKNNYFTMPSKNLRP